VSTLALALVGGAYASVVHMTYICVYMLTHVGGVRVYGICTCACVRYVCVGGVKRVSVGLHVYDIRRCV
jgi:hypothetical protein